MMYNKNLSQNKNNQFVLLKMAILLSNFKTLKLDSTIINQILKTLKNYERRR